MELKIVRRFSKRPQYFLDFQFLCHFGFQWLRISQVFNNNSVEHTVKLVNPIGSVPCARTSWRTSQTDTDQQNSEANQKALFSSLWLSASTELKEFELWDQYFFSARFSLFLELESLNLFSTVYEPKTYGSTVAD